MCACSDFLHITGSPSSPCERSWRPRAVMLIQVSQNPEPLPLPGSLKHHNLIYSCLSPLSSPTEPVWDLCPWPKLLQEIGICVLSFDLHQKCLVLPLWEAEMDENPAVVVFSQPWNARAARERLAGILVLPKIPLQSPPGPCCLHKRSLECWGTSL